jgi:hypothetical protein
MHARRTQAFRHALVALLALAVGVGVGGVAGCGGDPFCTVDELLNEADEVEQASDPRGRDFLIASPNGEIGVLARRPFAPDCTRRAKDALKRLARKSD